MTTAGLTLIIIGWGLQLSAVLQKNNKIQSSFIIFYSLGALLLVIDGFTNQLTSLALLNLLSFLVASAVWYKLNNLKKR
jgi:hypothetical protein